MARIRILLVSLKNYQVITQLWSLFASEGKGKWRDEEEQWKNEDLGLTWGLLSNQGTNSCMQSFKESQKFV